MNALGRRAVAVVSLLALLAGRAVAGDAPDAPDTSDAPDVRWRDAASLDVEGRGWAQTATPFGRLPESAQGKVNATAWKMAQSSAGVAVRFVTDAPAVSVRWSLASPKLDMPHMPATGVSGVDLYARDANTADGGKPAGGEWRFVGNGRPLEQDGNLATFELPAELPAEFPARRECLLYLPAYNGTTSLEVGVPAGATLDAPTPRPRGHRRPVVVYGTSITQGGCASRPGMVWPSILGRMLDRPIINLGVSGSGDMAPPVGEVLAELDPAAYVIDCTWNIGDDADVRDRVTRLVEAVRAEHPATPIVFMGQSHHRPEAHPTTRTRDQASAVEALQASGIPGLVAVAPADFIGDDGEGTVDGVHYNDLGMNRQALAMHPVVAAALDGAPDDAPDDAGAERD